MLVQPVHDIHARGKRAECAIRNFESAGKWLERQGIDFDVIDYKGILAGELRGGKLRLGDAVYAHAIVPMDVWLPSDADKRIRKLPPPTPSISCADGFSRLRVMTRTLHDGTLYFLYNESLSDLTTTVTLHDTRPVCRLNCEDAGIYKVDADVSDGKTTLPVVLASGEMAVYLCGNPPCEPAEEPHPTIAYPLTDFTAARISELTIDEEGMHTHAITEPAVRCPLGRWPYDENFSGSVRYRTTLTLNAPPSGTAMLDLSEVHYSAEVWVNAKKVGIAGLRQPNPGGFGNRVMFDAGCLVPGVNVVEIVVSNTSSGAFTSFPAHDFWEDKYLSPYYDRERLFEHDSIDGGLCGCQTPQGSAVTLYICVCTYPALT